VVKSRGVATLRNGEVRFSKKKAARVRGKQDRTVGQVLPEPGSVSCRTPAVERMRHVEALPSRAALVETGNPHYSALA
jgi:hypothetical protein